MKMIKLLFTIFCLVLLLIPETQAQNRAFGGPLRQRITEAKLREISRTLKLDQETMLKLRPVYIAYENELMSINFREMGGLNQINADSLSSEEADKAVLAQMANARKLLDLREKYYERFRTVLTPQQIIRLYQTEAAIRRKVMMELRRRFGGER
jgi:Spy/CpxP family protein refolding chaperone